MSRFKLSAAPLLFALIASGCSTTAVDMDEPRRVVGTENDVRVDAEIEGDRLSGAMTLPFRYEITNQRPDAIAVADMIPEATYDSETQTVTIGVGSEVPGHQMLPKLITIAPGEKKTFATTARIRIMMPPPGSMHVRYPNALRIKVNFLAGDLSPFSTLVEMKQKATADPKLADSLFSTWVDRTEVVYTNAVPMKWGEISAPPPQQPASRRRG